MDKEHLYQVYLAVKRKHWELIQSDVTYRKAKAIVCLHRKKQELETLLKAS